MQDVRHVLEFEVPEAFRVVDALADVLVAADEENDEAEDAAELSEAAAAAGSFSAFH